MSGRRRLVVLVTAGLLGLGTVGACSSSGSSGDSGSDSSAASSSAGAPSSSPTAPSSTAASASATPSASASGSSGTSQTASITIKDYTYSGASSVPAGTKITVTNEDSEAHTVTSDKGGVFDVVVPPGKSVTFTAPTTTGSFAYHCTYHGNMHGTLKVA